MCKRTVEYVLNDKLCTLSSVMQFQRFFLNFSNEVSQVYILTTMEPREDINFKLFLKRLPSHFTMWPIGVPHVVCSSVWVIMRMCSCSVHSNEFAPVYLQIEDHQKILNLNMGRSLFRCVNSRDVSNTFKIRYENNSPKS